jgi:SAM-dependent methyltransferase
MATTRDDLPYVLGRSEHETARLQRQAQLYGPLTRRLFVEAGLGSGMRVLDLGSGAGDVAMLVADLVGPGGQVVGVDMDAEILEVARRRVRAAGWTNVTFFVGDLRTALLEDVFDAVVGRFVLPFVTDRVEVLRSCVARVRPGGLVVFQEHDVASYYRAEPSVPIVEQWRAWAFQLADRMGLDLGFAMRLNADFGAAGLRAPQMRYEVPVGGGPDWIGYHFLPDHSRSARDLFVQHGIATEEEMQLDSLADRIRDEVMSTSGVFFTMPAVGMWARS